MSQVFFVSENNPNEVTGGKGCLCSGPTEGRDCTGPFVIFPATETESNISPHAVLCAPCLRLAYDQVENGEVLVAGEIDGTAELVEDDLSL